MTNTIAIIIPYFGKWPEWIELYWYSCVQNKEIDFHFFTDCKVPYSSNQFPNLFFHKTTFLEYCEKVSEKIGIQFAPKLAYKLCDLKPFYGFIHSDLLKGYTHWGFCDVDLIFGKVSDFVKIENYDVFSTLGDRISGHFCVLRNNNYFTNLCFKIRNWKILLTDDKSYALDENELSSLVYPTSWWLRKFYSKVLRKLFNWRDAYVIRYAFVERLVNNLMLLPLFTPYKMHFADLHTTPILYDDYTFRYDSDRWYYKNGEVINAKTGEPCIYVHFMIYKKNGFRKDYFWKDNFYHITPNDFNDVVLIKAVFPQTIIQ